MTALHKTYPRTYKSWENMKQRCFNQNNDAYERYGGRGISVCDSWLAFANFLDDMGPRLEGCTLDRIDNEKGYSPDNCKWSTPKQQANNRRRRSNAALYEFRGKKQTVCEWAKELGFHHRTLFMRLKRGWSVERAFTEGKHHNYDRFAK